MTQKTIAFSWIFPLEASGGGIERVTRRLMEGLSKRGYDCLFLHHDTAQDRFLLEGVDVGPLDAFLTARKVDTLINQNGYSSQISDLLAQSRWTGRYLVCHHNEPMYLSKLYDAGGALSQILRRDAPLRVRLTWMLRLLAYPLWRWVSIRKIARTQMRNYRRADRYLLLSPQFQPELSRLLRRADLPKAGAIANPLSFDVAPETAARFQKRPEVLIVSRLHDKEKRISLALAIWQRIERQGHPDWVLKIIGDGPDAGRLQQLSRKLGLTRVQFLGRQDPLPHYETAAVFMMTSRVEGWGLTLTEAMQTGTVPIAFDAYASLRDIVENGKTGVIVRNGDVTAFAAETRRLMTEAEHRHRLAAAAIGAAQRYRIEAILDQWEAVL